MRQKLLETIITLTEQRDIESLEYWLLTSMADLFTARRLVLYKPVSEHRSDSLLKEALTLWYEDGDSLQWRRDGRLVEPQGALKECLKLNDLVRERQGGLEHCYFPVIDHDRVMAVLVLSSRSGEKAPGNELAGLCRIYRNYLNVLFENAHDQLTGLLNRKTFDRSCHELITAQRSHQRLLAKEFTGGDKRILRDTDQPFLAIVDIDHFKRINDDNGHLFGDEILLLMTRIMREVVRGNDLLFRFGGEEFVILIEPTPADHVYGVLEKLRLRVESNRFPRIGQVTISIGYAVINGNEHITQVIDRADKALYFAKENGRNAVFSYEDLLQEGLLSQREVKDSIELF